MIVPLSLLQGPLDPVANLLRVLGGIPPAPADVLAHLNYVLTASHSVLGQDAIRHLNLLPATVEHEVE